MTIVGFTENTWLSNAFGAIEDATVDAKPALRIARAAVIALALAAIWVLVYATNGTHTSYLHMMYVPIIVASLTLGILPGVATAVLAALIVGPLMPMNVELSIGQPLEHIIYRGGFFVLIAVTSGAFAESARRRHRSLDAAKWDLAAINSRNLRLFARLVANRDEQTGNHCERVAHNAVVVARDYGLDNKALNRYYWTGLLHDLGKLGVPESILRKLGPLTTDEFTAIKAHPAFGERMLLDISESFADIAAGVRSHHERWDGKGYPDGLAGGDIPLIGRIIALVDVFEAVTSHRPYRGPMDDSSARALIAEGSGSHFDPDLAARFLNLEQQGTIMTESHVHPLYDERLEIVFSAFETLPAFS